MDENPYKSPRSTAQASLPRRPKPEWMLEPIPLRVKLWLLVFGTLMGLIIAAVGIMIFSLVVDVDS